MSVLVKFLAWLWGINSVPGHPWDDWACTYWHCGPNDCPCWDREQARRRAQLEVQRGG